MQRKIVVTGCFNCPYLEREEHKSNDGGLTMLERRCAHPSHVWPKPYIPDYVVVPGVQIGNQELRYLPHWCPLPSDNL